VNDPPSLGDGWSIADNRRKLQSCVSFATKQLNYQDKRARVSVAEDYESLARGLEVSVSAQFNGVLSNFSANASFVNNSKFSATSLNVAVFAEVTQGPQYAAPLQQAPGGEKELADLSTVAKKIALLPEFRELAAKDISEFRRQCGDGFVSVILSGARINGILTFRNVSREESQTIIVAAGGGGASSSFSSSLKSLMEKYEQEKRFDVVYLGLGGADDSIPLTKEALIAAVEHLPEKTKAGPRPFEMQVTRYEELPNWPPIILPRTLSDLEVLATSYWRMRTLYLYVEEALTQAPWILVLDTKRSTLLDLQVEILSSQEQIRKAIENCIGSDTCSAGSWREWNDLDIRSRLPMRGTWADIKYVPDAGKMQQIFESLANARVEYWITPVVKLRCQRDNDCIPVKTVDQMKEQMIRRMQASLQN
jgi:hypothetical protein